MKDIRKDQEDDGMRSEYRFDYSSARPNRFVDSEKREAALRALKDERRQATPKPLPAT